MQQPILVLGAGSWGTALAMVLARKGHTVYLWARNPEHVQQMQATRCNARFLPAARFPETLQAISDLTDYISEVEDFIVVVPSHAFRETLLKILPYLSINSRICWATKGLENSTGLLLNQVAMQVLGTQTPLAVLSGPSFATEVAAGLPTAVTIASHTLDYAQFLVTLFHDHSFRAYTSMDMIGVQLGGAVKNVIAIAAGIADGLKLGANSRAALITRGLTEMVRFGTALGGQRETFMGLAGVGDLVLTCTDNQSRNYRFGAILAQGCDTQQALTQIGQVVEGIYTAQQVNRLAQQSAIDMPIVAHVYKVLQGLCTPSEAVHALLSREPKQELI